MASAVSWYQEYLDMPNADIGAIRAASQALLGKIANNESKKECEALEDILNQMILAQKDEKYNGKTIGDLIAQRMESEDLLNRVGDFDVTGSLGIVSDATREAIVNLKQKQQLYKEAVAKAEQAMINQTEGDAQAALSKFRAINGRLNKIRGDVFEGFIQYALEVIKDNSEKLAVTTANDLVDQLATNIMKSNTITTKGSQHELTGKNGSSSQGKVDVSISADGPFKEDWNISAKNYSKLRDLSLLGDGNGAEIIGAWPASDAVKNYYYNALSVWAPGGKGIAQYLKEAERLIGIQGLVSHKGSGYANYLILNIRSNPKHPIRVIPIKYYIEQLLLNSKENPFIVTLNTSAYGTVVQGVPSLRKGQDRYPDIAQEAVDNFHIKKVALKSSYLTLNNIARLQY